MRQQLVDSTLEWERAYGNAPSITSALSEYDAAKLLEIGDEDYSIAMQGATAVQRGFDFQIAGTRYQIKANRPSGKRGSKVTRVPKASNYDWDSLIWILYNPNYDIEEAWLWNVADYKAAFDRLDRLSPEHYRKGIKIK